MSLATQRHLIAGLAAAAAIALHPGSAAADATNYAHVNCSSSQLAFLRRAVNEASDLLRAGEVLSRSGDLRFEL